MTRAAVLLRRTVPWGWAVALALLLLGPALGHGFTLVRDMVWVPDLALRPSMFGSGSALPRAVPSDAVVGILDEVVPGMLLQKVALLGGLLLAAGGAMQLAGSSTAGRLAAVTVTLWNPFVIERLWIGHWPVVLGYAAVPWLAWFGARAARTGHVPMMTYPVLVIGCLSANAGLVSSAVLLATGVRRARVALRLIPACLVVNAPWLVSGIRNADHAVQAGGFDVFGTRADALPVPLTLLSLGGIWNAEVVPSSRESWLAWIFTLLFVVLAIAGWRRWQRHRAADQRVAWMVLWGVGIGLALLSGWAPDALAALNERVPGAALFRDGTRSLALCLPLVVTLVAAGTVRLVHVWSDVAPRAATLVVIALAPVALMPDAAWGGGHLGVAQYPDEWSEVRSRLADETDRGTVVVLPWSAYRAPSWNEHRAVLDPLPRFLAEETLSSGDLIVNGVTIPGEDPRGAEIDDALAAATPEERADALAGLGIDWVVVERDAGPSPAIAGEVIHEGPLLKVFRVGSGEPTG